MIIVQILKDWLRYKNAEIMVVVLGDLAKLVC